MLEWFGRSIFFAAARLHVVLIGLLVHPEVRSRFGLDALEPAVVE